MKLSVVLFCRRVTAAALLLALLLGSAPHAAIAAPALPKMASDGAVSPAQEDPDSPANLSSRTVGSAEIALLWSEPIGSPNPAWHSSHKLYSFLAAQDSGTGLIRHPDEKCPLLENPSAACSVNPGEHDGIIRPVSPDMGGDHAVAMIAADLNGDGRDDLVSAWEAPGLSIQVAVPQDMNANLDWTTAHSLATGAGVLPDTNFEAMQMHLAAGDFDGDGQAEFVLAYRGNDETLKLEVYDTDGTLIPQKRATSADLGVDAPRLPAVLASDVEEYAIAAGDVDGDGRAEIVLASVEPHTPAPSDADKGTWGVYVAVYDVNGSGSATLSRQSRASTYPSSAPSAPPARNNNSTANGIGVITGDFDGDGIDEIVYATGITRIQNFPYDRTYLQSVQVETPGTLTGGGFERYNDFVGAVHMAAGDMDADVTRGADCLPTIGGDGAPIAGKEPFGKLRDELAVSVDTNQIQTYCVDATNTLVGTGNAGSSADALAIADVNEDGRGDLIAVQNLEYSSGNTIRQEMKITVRRSTVSIQGQLRFMAPDVTRFDAATTSSRTRTVALAAGDFDGKSYRFGEPTRYRQTAVVQPIVVLNAPPIHFDVLNGTTYDIGECYGTNTCAFAATYTKQSQNTVIGTTTLNSSWSVKQGLNLDLGVKDLSILKGSMQESFGESFSKSAETGQTINILMTDTASRDDRIFAVVVDYDIWEYPIYRGDPTTPAGYMVVVKPSRADNRWFASKSPDANAWQPAHEVGNILSYPNYQTPAENPDRASNVIWDNQSASFQVGPDSTPGEKWRLTFSKFGQIGNKTSHQSSFTLSGSAGLFFLNGDIEDTESDELVSTYTTQVNESIEIAIELGKTVVSPAGTFYTISPYVYWAKNGALVVDYLVNPSKDDRGGATWWQREYDTLPDPAFILPWRYDPEKAGQAIEGFTDIQRLRTKDITISPARPKPGDTVQLQATVHNYSFKSTASANQAVPVTVRFYLGDPAHGGELIATGATASSLGERGRETVRATWTVPADADWRYARIYAVIDPDNAIAEIHEENNKGWTVLDFVCAACTSAPDLSIVPGSIQIFRQTGSFYRVKAQIEAAGAGSAGVPVEFYAGNPGQQGRKIGEDAIAKIKRKGTYLIDQVVSLAGGVNAASALQEEIWLKIAAEGVEDAQSSNNTAGALVGNATDPGIPLYLPLIQR